MCKQQNINQLEHDLKLELGIETIVIHTHISLLIITPIHTYKIKKAKDLGFLNFQSLESRKHFCNEEIRLNKITAPTIYITSTPIYYLEGRFTLLKQKSPPVEFAVKMNSFKQGNLLTNCWDKINNKQLIDLSQTLALFHLEKAETSEEITNFGTFSRLKDIAQSNLLSVKNYTGITIVKNEYDILEENTLSYFQSQKLQDTFSIRRQQKKIRACHGDLHLNNLCVIDDRIIPFDCIEFNKEFHYIDTLYDLFFLIMDIYFKGYEEKALIVLSSYLEKTNDYFSINIFPLYLAMRATIRGKVISMETKDASISESQRNKSSNLASKYLNFANSVLNPKSGKVIIVSGLSGSGKTFLSKKIQERFPAIHLRSDVIRKLEFKSNHDLYDSSTSIKTYDKLLDYCINLSENGFNSIVDATFLDIDIRNKFIESLQKMNISYSWIYCKQDTDTLKSRISNRKNDYSDATVSVLENQQNKFDEEDFLNVIKPYIYVDNKDFESIITLILSE